MVSAVECPVATCAREGCAGLLTGRQRRWCSVACRRAGEGERRAAAALAVAEARDDELRARVVDAVELAYFLGPAARAAGVTARTVRRWAAANPVFRGALDEAREIGAEAQSARLAAAAFAEPLDLGRVRSMEAVVRAVAAAEGRRVRVRGEAGRWCLSRTVPVRWSGPAGRISKPSERVVPGGFAVARQVG